MAIKHTVPEMRRIRGIHFVGIGGAGMCGIAEVLANQGYDPVYGARPLARVVQTAVRNPLTEEILFGRLEKGGTVRIGRANDELSFDFQPTAPDDSAKAQPPAVEEVTSE